MTKTFTAEQVEAAIRKAFADYASEDSWGVHYLYEDMAVKYTLANLTEPTPVEKVARAMFDRAWKDNAPEDTEAGWADDVTREFWLTEAEFILSLAAVAQ